MKTSKLALMAALACGGFLSVARGAEAPKVEMSLIASDAMPKLGGYRPQVAKLSTEKPAGLKKAPEMTDPMYGTIPFGGKSYIVAVDEPAGQDHKLYIDANGNGDLTDDPAVEWKKHEYPGPNGVKLAQYAGKFKLPLGGDGKPVSLGVYRFDKTDPQRAMLKDILIYFADYAADGQITIDGKSHHAMLADDAATGDFRGKPAGTKGGSGIRLLIDLNGDHRFDFRSEMFDISKPFNVGGTTWQVADMTPAGDFKLVESKEKVAEIPLPPNLSPGNVVPSFEAVTIDGKTVHFPQDYKGRIVLLDFWATWCGPCMGEAPNVVKAYDQWHPKGFDILGVSLDQPNAVEKIKKVTADKGMTWPQIYDGKFWQAAIAQKYGIESIPAPVLVDGDTGKVLAAQQDCRGEKLQATLKTELAKKENVRHPL